MQGYCKVEVAAKPQPPVRLNPYTWKGEPKNIELDSLALYTGKGLGLGVYPDFATALAKYQPGPLN